VRRLGSQYVLHERLGRGASGEVWRSTREADGAPVAVKLLHAELADDADVVDRFLRERRVLLGFDHPRLVRVRDLVAEGGTLAIVMDLIDGSDLRRYLRARGSLTAPDAVALSDQVLDALAVVHAQGVVHRDIKPENILVDTSGPGQPRALVTDFGIARLTDGPAMTRRSGLIGTPRYMAPELSTGARATPAADLYSVGIVLYELLRGRAPFDAPHPMALLRAHLEQPPAPLDGLPGTLWPTLARLLAKDPAQRPPTAGEARAELAEALAGAATPGHAGPDPDDPVLPLDTVILTTPPLTDMTPQADSATSSDTLISPLTPPAQPVSVTAAGDGTAHPDGTDTHGAARWRRLGWTAWGAVVAAVVVLTGTSWGLAAALGGGTASHDAARSAISPSAVAPAGTVPAGNTPMAHDVVDADLPAPPSGALGATADPAGASPAAAPAAQPPDDGRSAVPDVRDLSLDEAAARLKGDGFTNIPYLYGCYPGSAGRVVRQDPAPGVRVAGTDPVHLYLRANNCATVPDVRGQALEAAAAALKGVGFTNIPYVYECLGSPRIGAVVSQTPAPGTVVVVSDPVSLRLQANNC